MHRKTTAEMSKYRAGDEVFFKFDGLLLGTVKRVQFKGRKVRYEVTLDLECEVPETQIAELNEGGARDSEHTPRAVRPDSEQSPRL